MAPRNTMKPSQMPVESEFVRAALYRRSDKRCQKIHLITTYYIRCKCCALNLTDNSNVNRYIAIKSTTKAIFIISTKLRPSNIYDCKWIVNLLRNMLRKKTTYLIITLDVLWYNICWMKMQIIPVLLTKASFLKLIKFTELQLHGRIYMT